MGRYITLLFFHENIQSYRRTVVDDEWVTVTDVLNLNSMINWYIIAYHTKNDSEWNLQSAYIIYTLQYKLLTRNLVLHLQFLGVKNEYNLQHFVILTTFMTSYCRYFLTGIIILWTYKYYEELHIKFGEPIPPRQRNNNNNKIKNNILYNIDSINIWAN